MRRVVLQTQRGPRAAYIALVSLRDNAHVTQSESYTWDQDIDMDVSDFLDMRGYDNFGYLEEFVFGMHLCWRTC